MAIAEDASTPAVVQVPAGTTGTATSASFSPPANTLVVVTAAASYSSSTGTTGGSSPLSCADSLGNSYSAPVFVNQAGGWGNAAVFIRYYASAPGSITVTVTNSNLTTAIMQAAPRVLTGAASSQAGAGSGSASATASGNVDGPLTTTTAGSWVYAVATLSASLAGANPVPLTGTTNVDTYGPVNRSALAGRQSAATVTPGAVTVGWSIVNTINWSAAGLEILPASTLVPGGATLAGAGSLSAAGTDVPPSAPVKGDSSASVGESAGGSASVSKPYGSRPTVTG